LPELIGWLVGWLALIEWLIDWCNKRVSYSLLRCNNLNVMKYILLYQEDPVKILESKNNRMTGGVSKPLIDIIESSWKLGVLHQPISFWKVYLVLIPNKTKRIASRKGYLTVRYYFCQRKCWEKYKILVFVLCRYREWGCHWCRCVENAPANSL